MLMLCYPKCSTCKKAIRHLEEKGLKPQIRDISRENPTAEELRGWIAQSGLQSLQGHASEGSPGNDER